MRVGTCILRGGVAAGLIATGAALLLPGFGLAQEVSASNPNQVVSLTIRESDKVAIQGATGGVKRILTPKSGYGMRRTRVKEVGGGEAAGLIGASTGNGGMKNQDDTVPANSYFTMDLSNPGGGAVIESMISHPLYVNTLPASVGNPGTLLTDLEKSSLVHVLDQYVGSSSEDRYKVGLGALVIESVKGPLYDSDIQSIVHAGASLFGDKGHHAQYDIFLGKGQDVCFGGSGPADCYSPDHTDSFTFCAYHNSVVFSDIGEVIYSVIPYQAVPGCEVGSHSPNGSLIDSTMSALSHEYSESITDPDGDAWLENSSLDLFGYEIGDVCQNATFDYPVVKLNGKPYELQGEYSNRYHSCAYVP